MANPYVSNSPKYLDYIASTMTREEILADDRLCKLLNDPYIKDNMETALAFAEAEAGGYNEKVQFVKQFLCNGPELDVDTIIHYRNIILDDEEYSSIAATYFTDISVVDDFRINEFGKDTASTSDNCFLNPCNYLDTLSLNLGMMGDPANFRTIRNLFSLIVKKKKDEKDEEEAKKQGNQNNEGQNTESENSSEPKRKDVNDEAVNGNIRPNILRKILPGVAKGYSTLNTNILDSFKNFAEELANSNIPLDLIQVGDYDCIRNSEAISTMVKSNIFSLMGDCARVWNNLRSLNYYKQEQNTVKPAPASAEVSNKTITGTPKKKPINKSDASATLYNVKAVTGGGVSDQYGMVYPETNGYNTMFSSETATLSSNYGMAYQENTSYNTMFSSQSETLGGGVEISSDNAPTWNLDNKK